MAGAHRRLNERSVVSEMNLPRPQCCCSLLMETRFFSSQEIFYLVLREQSCFWDIECHRCGATVWRWDSGSGDVLDLLREVVCLSAPCSVGAHCGCQVNVRLSLFPAFEVSFPTHDKWFPRSSCRKGKNSSPANHSPEGVNPVECPIL